VTKIWSQVSLLVLTIVLPSHVAAQSIIAVQAAPMTAVERQQGAAATADIIAQYGGPIAGVSHNMPSG